MIKRAANRFLIVLLLALLLVMALVRGWVAWASRDIAPPDVDDLKVGSVVIDPADNACTYFLAAVEKLYWPTNSQPLVEFLEGKPVDGAVVAEIISKNAETLQLVDQGLGCRRCVVPDVTEITADLPYLAPWRNIGRVLAARTRQLRLAGRINEATISCVSLCRFGDMIQADAGGIIHYLVGVSILDLGLGQALDIARDPRTQASELHRLGGELAQVGSFVPGLVSAIKVEYRVAANTVDQFPVNAMGLGDATDSTVEEAVLAFLKRRRMSGYVFQPNRTKQMFASVYREMIGMAPACYGRMHHFDIEEELGLKRGGIRWVFRPNAVGRILCGMMAPTITPLMERKCRIECSLGATRLIVACQSYEKREGVLPANLQVLVPAYLQVIPPDPYDGSPFRYDRDRGIVYSVGKDLKDSGGSLEVQGHAEDLPSRRRWITEDVVFDIARHVQD